MDVLIASVIHLKKTEVQGRVTCLSKVTQLIIGKAGVRLSPECPKTALDTC